MSKVERDAEQRIERLEASFGMRSSVDKRVGQAAVPSLFLEYPSGGGLL